MRRADEAEDEYVLVTFYHVSSLKSQRLSARLVSNEISDKYTTSPLGSPRHSPRPQQKSPNRKQSVSERISQRLKEFGLSATDNAADSPKSEQVFDMESEKSLPVLDKGKGKAVDRESVTSSPPPQHNPLPLTLSIVPPSDPEPVFLSGRPFTPLAIAQLLTQAKKELPLRAVRFPILGEYQDCFTGEEFVTWLKDNVQVFDRNLDVAAAAAKTLTEREDLLRRLGEFGNAFENTDDAFYQFRPKVGCTLIPQYAS
jgi:hypothetical protein